MSVVEAALSFLDEFDLDVLSPAFESTSHAAQKLAISTKRVASSDTSPSEVKTNDATKRSGMIPERKKVLHAVGVYGNSNRVRNNPRIEILYLKEQLEKLQIDLEVLKKQKEGDVTRTRAARATPSRRQTYAAQQSTSDAIVATNTPTMTTVWENIADSQRRRRKKAECENIRLKMVIEHQQKVADNLRNLIQKRASQLGAECSFFTDVNYTNHHVLDLQGDVGEFQSLFRHLDNAYQELDAVFAANGLNNMVVTRSDVQVRDCAGGKYVELLFNKVLPFNLQDARQATWEHFRGSEKHMGNGRLYQKTVKDVNVFDTILEEFTKEMHSNSARVDANMKQVIRRYMEFDRDVITIVRNVSPAEVKHKMLTSLRYQVRCYIVTKRSSISTPEREVCQLQCCSLISFEEETVTQLGPDAIRTLSNFLIDSLAAKMQAHQDCIENALIDHALHVH
ncbi:hypothetical protein F443_14435 [Phytophthora nicotianae P1569]|uniref:Uncharacterized protein n=1 Tax=Phytophthora nicotianae P1569 TaxID=1317065 RepID=V9EMI6_PHYNI|nr:hypothetical protein F443_14435 [Phytophthora nicotianae P1569]